jgi:hypothetical protein
MCVFSYITQFTALSSDQIFPEIRNMVHWIRDKADLKVSGIQATTVWIFYLGPAYLSTSYLLVHSFGFGLLWLFFCLSLSICVLLYCPWYVKGTGSRLSEDTKIHRHVRPFYQMVKHLYVTHAVLLYTLNPV